MQQEWQKERHALLNYIKEKEEQLKDFEKVRYQQRFNSLRLKMISSLYNLH